ncbi:hypothetical protein D3C71_1547770 [compost metagenome]
MAIMQVELHRVLICQDPAPSRFVDQGSCLAEAPSELAAGIIRHVPEQLAQVRARHRVPSERKIGDQRAQLARGRQDQCSARPADPHRPKHADTNGGAIPGKIRMPRQGRFHAGYHARLHVPALRLTPDRTTRVCLRTPSCDSASCRRYPPARHPRPNGDRPCPHSPPPRLKPKITRSPT